MLNFLRNLLSSSGPSAEQEYSSIKGGGTPVRIEVDGAIPFSLAENLRFQHGLPFANWQAVYKWIKGIQDASTQADAWAKAELGWLAHLQEALGPEYQLIQAGDAVLLSSLEARLAQQTLEFMTKTVRRVGKVLDGLVQIPEWGHDILIVFDEDDTYYRYVSRYYPESGEFGSSSGMHISDGCSHFVTTKSDLSEIEPVIVHEMTHGCLSHLPLPAWLNEGLAVNTEQRFFPPPSSLFTPQEKHAKHMQFWGEKEIQEFWSGKSFLRADDGNMLSYDLARILVSQFAHDWESFKKFALAAHFNDGGQNSALQYLNLRLGTAVCAILEKSPDPDWEPQPGTWSDAPEQGAFSQ